jgi:hypothetical protein
VAAGSVLRYADVGSGAIAQQYNTFVDLNADTLGTNPWRWSDT